MSIFKSTCNSYLFRHPLSWIHPWDTLSLYNLHVAMTMWQYFITHAFVGHGVNLMITGDERLRLNVGPITFLVARHSSKSGKYVFFSAFCDPADTICWPWMIQCWSIVYHADPTLAEHKAGVLCLLVNHWYVYKMWITIKVYDSDLQIIVLKLNKYK